MPRKMNETESNTGNQKLLVNVGEHRKSWLEAVASAVNALIGDRGEMGSVTETMKCVIDQASVEDPESYAGRLIKWRTRVKLERIEQEERDLQMRKAAILEELENRRENVPAEHL